MLRIPRSSWSELLMGEVSYHIKVLNLNVIHNMSLNSVSISIFLIPVLASWFRLKYPHVALGALASSAPILYFEDITPQNGYYSIVTKDFRVLSLNFFLFSYLWALVFKKIWRPYGLVIFNCRKLVRVATKLYENHGLKSIELLLSPMAFQSLAKNSELASK